MNPITATTVTPAVFVTANRAIVYGTVSRWLLHDLRNPAQALSLVNELFAAPGGEIDPDLKMTLNTSVRQLTNCVELLDHALRTVACPSAGKPVVLSDVLRFLSRIHQTCRSSVQLDVSNVTEQPIPPVSGIEDYLEHALLNLMMNSIEAIGDREDGRIEMSAVVSHGAMELIVDDNGPGLPDEVHDRLFEPYVSTKRSSMRATGLGLTVARYLLELSGSTIAYAPKKEPGTRFVVRLPTWPATQY